MYISSFNHFSELKLQYSMGDWTSLHGCLMGISNLSWSEQNSWCQNTLFLIHVHVHTPRHTHTDTYRHTHKHVCAYTSSLIKSPIAPPAPFFLILQSVTTAYYAKPNVWEFSLISSLKLLLSPPVSWSIKAVGSTPEIHWKTSMTTSCFPPCCEYLILSHYPFFEIW